jgi:hypothetical protein
MEKIRLLGIQEFGDALIRTRDLDPVYCGLVGARLPRDQLARWLLAYWCFYHVGSASRLSEHQGDEFWKWMNIAACNLSESGPKSWGEGPDERWPRAAERRHFRGQKCVDAVEWLSKAERQPEGFVRFLETGQTDKQVMAIVQSYPMFGPWIAFKAADMMERVWGAKIKFDPNLGLMYAEPRAALDVLIEQNPTWSEPTPKNVYERLLVYFGSRRAPPTGDRPCGPQEVETALCKWKSHAHGGYWIGKDIHEQRVALAGWGETANKMLAAYPPEVPAQEYA